MTECTLIHRCLYEGDNLCIIRKTKLPEIQVRLDAICDEEGFPRMQYKLILCQNCQYAKDISGYSNEG